MEGHLWKKLLVLLKELPAPKESLRNRFKSVEIVRVILWAVLHDRPISWATQNKNWPIYARRWSLPSNATISRRYRHASVRLLLKNLEDRALLPQEQTCLGSAIDGKSLTIGGCSKDRQAGYGRAAGCYAKGYKLHAIISLQGALVDWRLTPINKDERVMARRMISHSNHQGYLLGDSNYDSNPLHKVCDEQGELQLLAPRRRGGMLGRHRHEQGRLRSVALLENPYPQFAQTVHKLRDEIERFFANLTNWGGGLTSLPAWARTYKRVHRWVQAKLIFNAIKRGHADRT